MGGVFTKYPAQRYHKTLAPEGKAIRDPDQEAREAPASEGWVDTPAKFDQAYVALTEDPPEGTPFESYVAPAKDPIAYPAMRYTRDGQEQTVATAEQDAALDPAIWKDTPDPAAWDVPVTSAAASEDPDPMHAMTVAQIAEVVETVTSPDELDLITGREAVRPDGARKGVLAAIEARRKALTA